MSNRVSGQGRGVSVIQRHPVGRVLALLSALVLIVSSLLTAPTAAAQEEERVVVSIDATSTPVIDTTDPDQVIRLNGTVTNTSGQDLRYIAVHFWRSVEPITTPEELEGILTSPPTVPVGQRMVEVENRHFQLLTTGEEAFPDGETRPFTVEATVGELGFTQDESVYLLGVQVRIVGQETIARSRLLAVATQNELPRTDVVQLTTTPSRTANGDFLNDHLTGELTGGLMELTQAAQRSGATVLVDPALVADVQALTEPHNVGDEVRQPVPEAAQWLQIIDELVAEGRTLRLAYGDPHLARLDAMDRLDQFLDLAGHQSLPRLADVPLAAAVDDEASDGLLRALAEQGFAYVFAFNATSGTLDGMQVIGLTDPTRPGPGPEPNASEVDRQGRRLAEQLLGDQPPVHLIRTTTEFEALDADGHETQVPPSAPRELPTVDEGTVPEPWPTLLAEIDELHEHADFVADLTGIDEMPVLELTALNSVAATWLDEDAAVAFLRATPLANADPSAITISAVGQFVMGSRTNDFPVTITNGMEDPVRVRLTFTSDVPQRISVPATELVDIQAGQSLTLNIAPTATSNGVVQVTARLETAGGRAFGAPVPIQITATDLGRVGWIIIIVSGAVVLGGTFLRIRAVRAEQAKENSEQSGQ